MTTQAATLPAYAKLNLFLEVTGKRPDGYHNLESVFVEISLADRLHAVPHRANLISLLCDDPGLPLDSRNLVVKAAALLQRRCGIDRQGLALQLQKNIPAGSGLGGGSSDAAAVLRLANELWECGLDSGQLAAIGAEIGSDVPFFLYGGAALVSGRGENIAPLEDFPKKVEFGLAIPPIVSYTGQAYAAFRLPDPGKAKKSASAFVDAMRRGDVRAMEQSAFNRFEASVFAALPALQAIHAGLQERLACPVRMSGSGSALWFFAAGDWQANRDLQQWAEDTGVRLLSAHAVPGKWPSTHGQP